MDAATAPQTFYDKPLFGLLSGRLTEFRAPSGVFSVEKFACALQMSREGVYKWLRSDKLSPEGARKIVDLSIDIKSGRHRIKKEELYQFCFPA